MAAAVAVDQMNDVDNGASKKVVKTTEQEAQEWLKTAELKEILANDNSYKFQFLLLSQPNGELGVLLANKSAFSEEPEDIKRLIESAKLKELTKNDIFGNYEIEVAPELNLVKSQLIFPANEKIIAKYRREEKVVINETPEDYRTITCDYIDKSALNLNWVYNLLNKEKEVDRMVFEDPDPYNGFILSKDIKWDGTTIQNLYVLAIVHRKGIRTIRDLRADDLPMLIGIRDKCYAAILEQYGLKSNEIRAYFHYQPSFYHLHVHFVNIKYEAPASITLSAILLNDVINNISLVSDYYDKVTLQFTRKTTDKLTLMYKDAGRLDM